MYEWWVKNLNSTNLHLHLVADTNVGTKKPDLSVPKLAWGSRVLLLGEHPLAPWDHDRAFWGFLVKQVIVLFTENEMRPTKNLTGSLWCFFRRDGLNVYISWNLKTTKMSRKSLHQLKCEYANDYLALIPRLMKLNGLHVE